MAIHHFGRLFWISAVKHQCHFWPLSPHQSLKLPSVLAAIPVSGCHQAGPGSCSHRDSPQLHHRAQLLWPAPDTAGLARLVAALSVIRLAATAAVSYRARRVDTRNTRVSSTTAPDTTASWSWWQNSVVFSTTQSIQGSVVRATGRALWPLLGPSNLSDHPGASPGQREGRRHAAQRCPVLL